MKERNGFHKRFFFAARRSLFSILVLGVFLSGYASLFGEEGATAAEFAFEQYEVEIGTAKRQTVLTGFLLGGNFAELTVVYIDENDSRRLHVYAFGDGAWTLRLDTTLRSEVLFVDVANIDGRDRLITYERGRLNWFDPESMTEHPLVTVTSNFKPPRSSEIPHVDLARDVNGDARDDLVVPDSDGFWVFIQLSDGAFAEKVQIGPPTKMERIRGADGYRYDPWSQSRVHEIDYDGDGRTDLVFWDEDHFKVHLQDEHGLFAQRTKTFTIDVAFDSDRLSLLIAGDMIGKVLHSLADLNNDGIADLVVFKISGKKTTNKYSTYEVHFGAPAPDGGIVFSQDVDIAFESDEKILFGMEQHDFNRDGKVDLMITTIDLEFLKGSFWKSIKGFMGDDIWLDLEFYQMKEGCYPNKPNTTRSLALDGVPSHREPGWVPLDIVLQGGTHENRNTQKGYPRAFNTTLRVGDVTGDGRSDLLLADHPRIMVIFVGVPGPKIFARQPQEVKIAIPNDEEYIWLVDLNKDGVQDILMHYPFTQRDAHGAPTQPLGTERHRVRMLIAR